jgi:hypothetical protein
LKNNGALQVKGKESMKINNSIYGPHLEDLWSRQVHGLIWII